MKTNRKTPPPAPRPSDILLTLPGSAPMSEVINLARALVREAPQELTPTLNALSARLVDAAAGKGDVKEFKLAGLSIDSLGESLSAEQAPRLARALSPLLKDPAAAFSGTSGLAATALGLLGRIASRKDIYEEALLERMVKKFSWLDEATSAPQVSAPRSGLANPNAINGPLRQRGRSKS